MASSPSRASWTPCPTTWASWGCTPRAATFPRSRASSPEGGSSTARDYFLSEYPVSKQWFRLLTERMDAMAVLYRVAAMTADADPHKDPVRVDHYRNGPYDMLVTPVSSTGQALSGGRSIGVIRQGAALPTSNLRYRLRSMERLPSRERPFVTLVLTHADQATRRAIRSLGDPSEHRSTFVATEGELLAGDHTGTVWQQCGSGLGENPPVLIDPDTSLANILAWIKRVLDASPLLPPRRPEARSGIALPVQHEGRHAGAVGATRTGHFRAIDPRRERTPSTCWPHGPCAPASSWLN